MASIDLRLGSWALQWRLGGGRAGARQTLTFPYGDSKPAAREAVRKLAAAYEKKPGATNAELVTLAGISESAVSRFVPKYRLVLAAKQLVESRGHAMTRDQVRAAVLTTPASRPSGTPTFQAWAEDWIAHRRIVGDIQPDSLDSYERVFRTRAYPYLGSIALADITPDTIKDWLSWLQARKQITHRGKPIGATTIGRTYVIVKACLGAAVPKWIPSNPAERPPGTRRHPSLPKREPFEGMFLTPAELSRIIECCPPPIRDLVVVASRTGLRVGELIELQRRDLELGRTVRINVARTRKADGSVGPPKSERSRRRIGVDADTAAILHTHAEGLRDEGLLFRGVRGGRLEETTVDHYWSRALGQARRCAEHPPPVRVGVSGRRLKWQPDEVSDCACRTRLHRKPRFHDLRHTHASLLIAEGWPPIKIQRRLGHASITMTMDVYGHLWEDDDDFDLLNKANARLSGG